MPSEGSLSRRHIIMRGLPIDIGMRVQTWQETEWEFVGRQRTHTRAIICHWTGAENPPGAMYFNMLRHLDAFKAKSPLSVHFCIDQRGNIFQMADCEMRCAHAVGKGGARSANGWSVGIEFVGRGSDLKKPSRGYDRPRVTEMIHGRRVTYDELYDRQIAAGVALVEKLCGLYSLPLKVPEDAKGAVFTKELGDEQYDTWRGVLGHLHVEGGKYDPGAKLLRAIQARGRELDRERA